MIHPLIPDAALDQHKAIIGKTGSGKTYAAKSIVEALVARGRQVCIIDPTGAWWGMRLAADGTSPGLSLVIIGGEHGDVPLAPNSGAAVASLVAERGASVVVDTSGLLVGEYTRWFTDFAGTLFAKCRHPLDLVIDEAHQYMPQDRGGADPQVSRMLHAGNRLMSGGRSRGIRAMLITQRPAKLHKDALTCADTLIAMRVIAPQDRAAIKAWIDGSGDAADGKKVLDSIASLQPGEGWVWYPEGGHMMRSRFPAIATYDSSAAPRHGAREAPKLGEIRLDDVRGALADAVREAEANDPKRLRARIAELERQARTAPPDQAAIDRAVSSAVAVAVKEWRAALSVANRMIDALLVKLRRAHDLTRDEGISPVADPTASGPPSSTLLPVVGAITSNHANGLSSSPADPVRPDQPRSAMETVATTRADGPRQRILDAAAWWSSIGVETPTRNQVGFVARIKPTGGHFANTIGPLITGGLLAGSNGTVALTAAGAKRANWPTSAPTLDAYHDRIRAVLATGAQRRIFDAIVASCGSDISAAEIGRSTGISAEGGHFANSIGPLSTLGLIERRGGVVHPTDLLFPPSLAGVRR